jgi:pimeloyl-ACP methyl ester carboxylesterase
MTLRTLARGQIFAEMDGEGEGVVVFLHGWGRDRSDLAGIGRGLQRQCLYLDLPGFGASPPPPEAWGARQYAEVVAQAIRGHIGDDLPQRPLVVVGHSFGGRVALCLAACWPGVTGLLLTGVPLLRSGRTKPAMPFRVARALHRRGLLPDAKMERYRQRYGSADYRAAHGILRDTLVRVVGESYEAELRDVRCPVTLVWGEDDTAAPVTVAREAEHLIAAPHKLIVAAGVGHDLHRVRPELLRTEIVALCRITA